MPIPRARKRSISPLIFPGSPSAAAEAMVTARVLAVSRGSKLSPLQKTLIAMQPTAVEKLAAFPAAPAARRFESLGSSTHRTAALKAAACLGLGRGSLTERRQRQAHHTASRLLRV